jgi:hypothetical protein
MITLNKNKGLWLFIFLFLSLAVLNNVTAEDDKSFVDKGNFLLSGMINVSNYSYSWGIWDDTTKMNILIIEGTSSFLGFISKRFGVGGDFHIRHMDEEQFELSLTQIGIGPKIAYFLIWVKFIPI